MSNVINIEVESGTTKTLLTAGKYCDKNIKVTAKSNVTQPNIQSLEITENGTYTASNGVDGYSPITVNVPIPEGFVKPSGTLDIDSNGEHIVTNYEKVNVNVANASVEPDYRELYQRVEYIESAVSGTYPYVITDVYANNSCGVEIVASFPTLVDRIPMGSREDSGSTRFYCVYPLSASSIYYGFNTGSTISCKLTVDTIYRLQTNFLNSRLVNVYDYDGIIKGGESISETLITHTVPISIFGYNNASTATVSLKREYKLYSARISNDYEVIREYIPCYRKSDGVVGLYEKFTGVFLTPETSTFKAGDNIEW